MLPKDQQVSVSIVTAAAPNRKAGEFYDTDLMYATIQNIFLAPRRLEPALDTLILGAWGCGAFGCDPWDVARLFARALKSDGLGHLYREVHFAIPSYTPEDHNADVFRNVLTSKGVALSEMS